MDAAHYLAELTRLVRRVQAEDLPPGALVNDSHGNDWLVSRKDSEFCMTHASDEKTATITVGHDGWLAFRVENVEF